MFPYFEYQGKTPFHADFSQSLDEQGLGLSAVPPFLVGGRCYVDAEAAAATPSWSVVRVRTSDVDRR